MFGLGLRVLFIIKLEIKMKRNDFLIALVTVLLVGCGGANDYVPAADATGEAIFSAACSQCHKPLSADVAMALSANMVTKEAIIKQVQTGSMRMPSFTGIQGEAADRLAEYILANSKTK